MDSLRVRRRFGEFKEEGEGGRVEKSKGCGICQFVPETVMEVGFYS